MVDLGNIFEDISMKIPALTPDQMALVDRLMIEEFHITLLQMMENAGRNLADLAQSLTKGQPYPSFIVLCGSGNNGGGGMVAARHLVNRGSEVSLVLIKDEHKLNEIPLHQWSILKKMGMEVVSNPNPDNYDLVIDAMIGYGLQGNPHGSAAEWIEIINASKKPILSLDIPSGLDATQGIPQHPCTRATATLTLALPKTGLLKQTAQPYVGDLYLADISVPAELYKTMSLDVGPIFKDSRILKI